MWLPRESSSACCCVSLDNRDLAQCGPSATEERETCSPGWPYDHPWLLAWGPGWRSKIPPEPLSLTPYRRSRCESSPGPAAGPLGDGFWCLLPTDVMPRFKCAGALCQRLSRHSLPLASMAIGSKTPRLACRDTRRADLAQLLHPALIIHFGPGGHFQGRAAAPYHFVP
jgi:hypothetical protein